MTRFCKNEACPTSMELLAFQNGDIPLSESGFIRKHLQVCEFCSAEVEFYERYPLLDDSFEPEDLPDMPLPLQELAEALMGKGKKEFGIKR